MITTPTVDEIRSLLAQRNASLACSTCGEDERFTIERGTLRGLGRRQTYGNYLLERTQVICDTCGHVESFDVDRLRAAAPLRASAPAPAPQELAPAQLRHAA
jgi:RNase P subunit RPR2